MYKPIQKYLHLEIGALLFLSYCLPLIIAKIFAADVKGVNQVLESVNSIQIIFLYAISFLSFYGPSLLLNRSPDWESVDPRIHSGTLIIVNALLAVIFIFSKIYVYKNVATEGYGFDTGAISDPIWTFSMFLSEVVVLISVMWLALGEIKYFWSNIILLQLNLLHGTRIYLMIAAILAFSIIIRKLPNLKIIAVSSFSFILFVAVSYLIFLIRHDSFESDFSLDIQWFFSPVLIESIFSQWSLINVLSSDIYFLKTEISSFLLDPIIFSLPRALFSNKESLMLAMDPDLSPLGALNGIAAAIIYFGYFFPIYWIFWGVVSAILLRAASTSYWARVIYLLFSFNLILRLMRDGYVMPVKIMINDIFIIAILYALFKFIPFLKNQPKSQAPKKKSHRNNNLLNHVC